MTVYTASATHEILNEREYTMLHIHIHASTTEDAESLHLCMCAFVCAFAAAYNGGLDVTHKPSVYLVALCWAIMTLTTIGYGDVVLLHLFRSNAHPH